MSNIFFQQVWLTAARFETLLNDKFFRPEVDLNKSTALKNKKILTLFV